jgi:alpha-galactosidase
MPRYRTCGEWGEDPVNLLVGGTRRICAALALAMMGIFTVPAVAQASPHPHLHAAPGNGLAIMPPMGFNDWYSDHCSVTEAAILTEAGQLVSSGLAAAGYNTVVVDDCWMAPQRTSTGALTWNPTTFPDGMPSLAAQIHAMGLKFGLYEDAGTETCQGFPGSYGHYTQDAATFASWGVDFVKLDQCHMPPGITLAGQATLFTSFGNAIAATGRNMVYSQELPIGALEADGAGSAAYLNAVKSSSVSANMWRVARDFTPVQSASSQLAAHLADDKPLYPYAGRGHWNDLDLLLAGNTVFGWSQTQAVIQMSIWAELASPLIISTVIGSLPASLLADLKNAHMIAIDQSGGQARMVATSGPVEAFSKPDPQGGHAVLLVNTSATRTTASIALSALPNVGSPVTVLNIWSGAVSRATGTLRFTVGPNSTALLQLTP